MDKSLTELMDDILTQISEQFETAVEKLAKRMADLTANIDKTTDAPKPTTDTLDGAANESQSQNHREDR